MSYINYQDYAMVMLKKRKQMPKLCESKECVVILFHPCT